MADAYETARYPEAELPRLEDEVTGEQTYAAGYTHTRTGEWVVPMLIHFEPAKSQCLQLLSLKRLIDTRLMQRNRKWLKL